MTSHTGRLYAAALALLVFFLVWAVIAARPWTQTKADPRLAALAAREQTLRRESVVVQRIVKRRWATYRKQLAKRKAQVAAARQQLAAVPAAPAAPSATATPSVRVVTLPPMTITRTS